jgi:hypothetical protein
MLGGDHDDDLVAGDGQRLDTVGTVSALDEPDLAAVLADRVDDADGVDDLQLRWMSGRSRRKSASQPGSRNSPIV